VRPQVGAFLICCRGLSGIGIAQKLRWNVQEIF